MISLDLNQICQICQKIPSIVHGPYPALRTPEPKNPGDASMRAHEGGQLREERERRVRTPRSPRGVTWRRSHALCRAGARRCGHEFHRTPFAPLCSPFEDFVWQITSWEIFIWR